MRIIFIGDVVGRSGRDAVAKWLPELKKHFKSDVVIVNGENAAHGMGISGKICNSFFDMGVDCITTGNHIWDQREIMTYIDNEPRLIRPANYPDKLPGKGLYIHKLADGRTLAVMNVMGALFMPSLHDPFSTMDDVLNKCRSGGRKANAVFVDFHAETTSEKMACGHYLDGRVCAVVGTHTHIPTADAHILPGGTAFQSDAGMTGDYNSVIGMDKEEPVRRFSTMMRLNKFSPADGEGTVCGCFVETDDSTGKATSIVAFQKGGILDKPLPSID